MIWPFRKSSNGKNLVSEYTRDLNGLTLRIKSLEGKLKDSKQNWTYHRWFHLYVLPIVLGLLYYYSNMWCISLWICGGVTLAGYLMINYGLWKFQKFQQIRYERKLSLLHTQYDEKLNQFKQESHYNEAHSMLNRFGQGEDQSVIMDDELQSKYDELKDLTSQIDQLKGKEDKQIWLDKVVGLIAGGTDLLVKIVCPECHHSTGCYRYVNEPIDYKCIECGKEIKELPKENNKQLK